MTNNIGAVHVRRQRGKLSVQTMGRTPRGQRFILDTLGLTAPQMTSPEFNDEMAAAVARMFSPVVVPQ